MAIDLYPTNNNQTQLRIQLRNSFLPVATQTFSNIRFIIAVNAPSGLVQVIANCLN